jgi:hypothetical protein
MYTKEIKRLFKENLDHPGSVVEIEYNAAKYGHIKSFRSTIRYVAQGLGIKIATDFNDPIMWVQRQDVSPLDEHKDAFRFNRRGDMKRASELIRILEPAPSDPLYNLKLRLVEAAEQMFMQQGYESDEMLNEMERANEG